MAKPHQKDQDEPFFITEEVEVDHQIAPVQSSGEARRHSPWSDARVAV